MRIQFILILFALVSLSAEDSELLRVYSWSISSGESNTVFMYLVKPETVKKYPTIEDGWVIDAAVKAIFAYAEIKGMEDKVGEIKIHRPSGWRGKRAVLVTEIGYHNTVVFDMLGNKIEPITLRNSQADDWKYLNAKYPAME